MEEMKPDAMDELRKLPGLVATVCLSGSVMEEFAMCRENMRAWNVAHGFRNVEYVTFNAVLVEHGRDEAVEHALREKYAWILQIDADATFPEDALARILTSAYVTVPESDAVGAYAQLKNAPYLPTIDTGTGTWEPHFPDEGILPVMRTGAHFLLTKTKLLARMGAPWFRTRRSMRPIDALRDVDNYARLKNHGMNPLAETETWDTLMEHALAEQGGGHSPVGEDSGFCDAALSLGAKIFVDTSLVSGHIGKRMITPDMLKEALDAESSKKRAAVGVYE